ncbi:hypothetical protein [Paraglaciecola sp. L1A13]|uniref:hypothetical protein n=1 Tax=Paraglaciecola sp. L1A13 TaxID=2686359 RepID=UPI001E4ED3B7|nr:hypothetical protein [Paraglaciecola sp. L1A13]|tara:strand:+ start:923 stop:1516 length:594 start_codon:yes stop_codon:yes gene_type:complete
MNFGRDKTLRIVLCIFIFCFTFKASAAELNWVETLNWLKQSLPQSADLDFNKKSIKFDGCHQRDYQLSFHQELGEYIFIETQIGYVKGELSWGAHNQKTTSRQWAILPRYRVNHQISLGLGYVKQMDTNLETSQGADIQLPASDKWLLSSRFTLDSDHQYVEVALSKALWQANDATQTWLGQGRTDKHINIVYVANF